MLHVSGVEACITSRMHCKSRNNLQHSLYIAHSSCIMHKPCIPECFSSHMHYNANVKHVSYLAYALCISHNSRFAYAKNYICITNDTCNTHTSHMHHHACIMHVLHKSHVKQALLTQFIPLFKVIEGDFWLNEEKNNKPNLYLGHSFGRFEKRV